MKGLKFKLNIKNYEKWKSEGVSPRNEYLEILDSYVYRIRHETPTDHAIGMQVEYHDKMLIVFGYDCDNVHGYSINREVFAMEQNHFMECLLFKTYELVREL